MGASERNKVDLCIRHTWRAFLKCGKQRKLFKESSWRCGKTAVSKVVCCTSVNGYISMIFQITTAF